MAFDHGRREHEVVEPRDLAQGVDGLVDCRRVRLIVPAATESKHQDSSPLAALRTAIDG